MIDHCLVGQETTLIKRNCAGTIKASFKMKKKTATVLIAIITLTLV